MTTPEYIDNLPIKTWFYHPNRSTSIRMLVGQREIGFNIDWVPEKNLDWFIQVLATIVHETYEQGKTDALENLGNELKTLIKLIRNA